MLVPWTGALVKLVDAAMPSMQINAARFTVQLVAFGLIMATMARGLPALPRPLWPLLARGAFMATGSACLYAGFRVMPLADASAIFFVEPLLITLLAAVVLGEPVGWRRMVAVAAGLVGGWIVIGPKFESIGWAALFPLGAAFAFAATSMFTRRFSTLADAPTMQFYASAIGAALLWSGLALAPALGLAERGPAAMAPVDLWLLLAIGLGATATSLMISQAFRVARVSTVAPFQYLELLGAAFVGWVVVGDLVSPNTFAGAALILGAGLFVFWRERRIAAG